ncbi:hypothetical protein P8C59_006966 [Phyllachora maydis]|uniref:Uncharacterized protein n=1 Tax=Phyllachora maydis TaxID=1825666 RepID=A0AAD9I8K8_9PEZI|nr:hypothetical protein P8C59_006966 [Phyllachora maydis]
MVAIQTVQSSNDLVASTLPPGPVALFIGGTSGIGLATLEQYAAHTRQPTIYFTTRWPEAAAGLVARLREANPGGTYTVLAADAALVRDVDAAVDRVLQAEARLDLLHLSAGYIGIWHAPTAEGLDGSLATRFYTRARAAQRLLPLLAAAGPGGGRVVSVLAAGFEGAVDEDDLGLGRPGAFGWLRANTHAATMNTLFWERLGREAGAAAAGVRFVHTYPGTVATPNLRPSFPGRLGGLVVRWLLEPLLNLVGARPAVAGARGLFYATSARYAAAGREGAWVPLVEGLAPGARTAGGVFLVDAHSEDVGNAETLGEMRRRGLGDKVWRHTQDMFALATAGGGGV